MSEIMCDYEATLRLAAAFRGTIRRMTDNVTEHELALMETAFGAGIQAGEVMARTTEEEAMVMDTDRRYGNDWRYGDD